MSKTIHQSPTEFAYPVARICGKISKKSKVVHRCTSSGKNITYIQGERNLLEHPYSSDEEAAKSLFSRRAKAAAARIDHKASTFQADLAAYRAQLDGQNPVRGFSKYIWSLVKAQITE